MELAKNQEHTVTIEGYGEGGMGVARIDGRVVFVHGALRGEKCRVLILKTLKSVAFAKVLEVIEPSSERITPDCPYFPRCGGCTYRHIRYEEELRLKKQRVQDNLSRIGGSDVTVEEILGARDTLRYRNKAQYPVSKDGAVGFYRARTHEVIECEHCLLVKPEADAAAEALREYMQSCRVAGYDEKTGRGLVRHLYIRSNAAGESLVCVLVNGDKLPKEDRLVTLLRDACPKCTGIVLGTNTKKGNVILGDRYRTLWGSDRLEDTLCGKTFRLSVPSFYQVNRVQAERLYAKAIEFAGLTGQETVLDLYCGAGTITLALSDHAKKVLGAEIVPEAIDDARENAARNGVKNAEFFCGDASDVAEGGEVAIEKMTTSTRKATIKKAMKGIGLTDEAVLSGYGNPVGEANTQLAQAIAAKVDNDCMDALQSASLIYDGSQAQISYNAIVDAVDLFEEEMGCSDKVLFIHPKQVTQLRKNPDFLSADKYTPGVSLTGEIGMIAGCRLVPSKKVPLAEGVYACPIVKLETDPEVDDEIPALTIYRKREVNIETERKPKTRTTEITADEFYVAVLSNEAKVVLAKFKA